VATQPTIKGLFTPETRPAEVVQLYEAAGQTPVLKMRQFDRLRRDGRRSSKIFMCTPVLSSAENRKVRRAILDEIETSKVRLTFFITAFCNPLEVTNTNVSHFGRRFIIGLGLDRGKFLS
jgi:hypothetical protein